MCSVGQYSNRTSPFSTHSQTKWCCTSICYVRAWWVDFWSMISHLDYRIESPSLFFLPCILNPWSILLSIWFFLWLVFVMYSTSVVDNAIVDCCLLLQEMAPPPIMKTNPVVDLLPSTSPPQSASQYPNISLNGVALNYNFIYNVPYKYLKIHLTTIQCSMLRLAMCWLNTFIRYAKSNRVHNMTYIKDPTACWYGNPFNSSFPFAFFCNFTLRSNGTPMSLHSSI